MAQITKILNVDVAKKNRFQALVAKQYDSKSRYLKVQLQNEGVDIAVESGCTVVMNARRADGESKGYAGSVNEDGTVTVPITSWMLALDDVVVCDVSVVDASARKLSTMSFEIEVDPASYSGDDIAEDDSYDLLVALLANVADATAGVQEATNAANQSAQKAEDAATAANSAAQTFERSAERIEKAVQSIEDANNTAEDDANRAEAAASRAEYAADSAEQELSTLEAAIELKGDNLFFNTEDGKLYLTSNGEVIGEGVVVATSGGGGGGGSSSGNNAVLTFTNSTGWLSKTIADGSACSLSAKWSSIEDDMPTGNGALSIKVGGVTKQTKDVAQGEITVDVGDFLAVGTNSVKLVIMDAYGNSRSLNFTISVVALSLASTFDATVPYSGAIAYTYIPTGSAAKTMHFKLDGVELSTVEVTVSGRQQTHTIPAQSHGAHSFEVWFTAEIDGQMVTSNVLFYDLICVVEGNTTPIVACAFNRESVAQYESVAIEWIVYNPTSLTAEVTLAANGTTISKQTVDRTKQTWTYRPDAVGELVLSISCGSTVKTITTTVEVTDIDIEAVDEDLELYLSSYGRNNNEANPASWVSGAVACEFANYNWVSDGWVTDESGVTVHRVSGDARLTIPLKLFAKDFRGTGKTIELEFATRNVLNYDATILSCFSGDRGITVTAQKALLKSEQSEISTQYKENEHIRIAFVVEKRAENRLIYIYINGIMSGVVQYPDDDDFAQAAPVDISIGSNECTVDLYNIRVYSNDLTRYQILDNWIADTQDITEKIERYERNAIFDAYGSIVIANLPTDLPYLVLQAPALPAYKGNKLNVDGYYTDPENAYKCFEFEDAQADVQGTSSAGYARKNFKIKFKNGFALNGVSSEGYQLRNDSIATDTFTFKADVASSEGANNVELVRLYNKICPFKTPPQLLNTSVRQGIDGFPIVIFHDNGNGAVFVGKYNFNNDKGTPEVYGFATGDESWEMRNNTSNRVLFKNADFSGTDWQSDFEARYPEDNTDASNLSAFVAWVASTDQSAATGKALASPVTYDGVAYKNDTAEYRLAKFKAELADHAELTSAVFYYLFTELFLMVDSRAKNAFPTMFGGGKVCWLPYDMDTAIGINNEGALAFGYELEDIDHIASGADVYNGQDSVFWVNLRAAFYENIRSMYQQLRSDGVLSYAVVEQAYEEHQSKWPEAIWNEDAWYKYLQPLVEDNTSAYLSMLQGSKEEQRKWWLYNRFRYLDSKYNAGDSLSDFITLRGYAKADVTVEPYADIYASIKYGSYLVQTRALRGSIYTLACPLDNVNDTEIYIYSASQLKNVGDLSKLKVGYAEFSMATKLQTLKLGDASAGYSNENLTELYLGNNTLLHTLDVRNCPMLGSGDVQQTVDLSGCTNIENVYFDGTTIKGCTLPNGGILKVLHLPDTITNLTIRNQSAITDFTIPGYSNISTLRLENVSTVVDSIAILKAISANSRVRLIGVNWNFKTAAEAESIYDVLDTMRGLDEGGNNTDTAQVSGKIHIPTLTGTELESLKKRYTNITITYDTISFYVFYKNADGTLLYTDIVAEGGNAIDPVATGKIAAPTRANTNDIEYTYNGWGTLPTNIKSNQTITAKYAESYAVRFYNATTLLYTDWVASGGTAKYSGSTPTKTQTAQYTYSFAGWAASDGGAAESSLLKNITATKNLYAAFTATVRKYTVCYYNGTTLLQTVTDVPYGSSVSYTGTTPTKASTTDYHYTFAGWSTTNGGSADASAGTNIVGDTNLYAAFTSIQRIYYQVKFYNGSSLLYTDTVESGNDATYSGSTPTKTQDAQYTYTFAGWALTDGGAVNSNALKTITSARSVFAAYSTTVREYTVYFYNGSTLLQTVNNVPYGGSATYTGTTPVDAENGMDFLGWSPLPTNITGTTSCYAQFASGAPTATSADGAYGVEWNYSQSATTLTRLGLAAGFSNPAPATSLSAHGSSPFDSIMPWSGMKKYNIVNGAVSCSEDDAGFSETDYDTVVYIPEFYYTAHKDADNNKWMWAISPTELDGFVKHPGSGRYIGRFHSSGDSSAIYSKSGVTPLANVSITNFNTYSHNKGDKWYQMDVAVWSALQLLYLIEFADFNSQSTLGTGQNTGSVKATGATTGALYHTLKLSAASNQYRWVENPFSNLLTWLDGFYSSSRSVYLTDANTSLSVTTSGKKDSGVDLPSSNGCISGFGYSSRFAWAFIPDTINGTTYTVYVSDRVYSHSSYPIAAVGGYYYSYANYGFFYLYAYYNASDTNTYIGSRLLYIP